GHRPGRQPSGSCRSLDRSWVVTEKRTAPILPSGGDISPGRNPDDSSRGKQANASDSTCRILPAGDDPRRGTDDPHRAPRPRRRGSGRGVPPPAPSGPGRPARGPLAGPATDGDGPDL